VRNYRLFFTGQLVSLTGTWMQTVAMALLVLNLTGRGTDLGLVVACQYLPIFVLTPVAGAIVDRLDRHRVYIVTQVSAAAVCLLLGLLVVTGVIQIWMVYVLAMAFGCVQAFDNPARQTLVFELVGAEHIANAVSLNSVGANLGRVVGPAIAAVFAATLGLGPCFLYNSASYLATITALMLMRTSELHRHVRDSGSTASTRDGLRYIRRTPEILIPLILLGIVGTLSWEFTVSLPLVARFTFHGGADLNGAMFGVMGVGAMFGGLWAATHTRVSGRGLVISSSLFGLAILAAAAAPTTTIVLVMMLPVGASAVSLIARGNTLLQLSTRPDMRGRVMSMWTIAIVGSTLVGGPIVGWMGDNVGARWGLALGGVAALVGAATCAPALLRQRATGTLTETEVVAEDGSEWELGVDAEAEALLAVATAEELELKG
jgi:MFS family permease